MSDPLAGKYQNYYIGEFEMADRLLAGIGYGGNIQWSTHGYEAFTYKDNDVSLVFYPHKTSANNYHIRIRNQSSKNPGKALFIAAYLDHFSGANCTFSVKNTSVFWYRTNEQINKFLEQNPLLVGLLDRPFSYLDVGIPPVLEQTQ